MKSKLTLLLLLLCFLVRAQDPKKLALLQTKIDRAPSDSDRIVALGALADYYYAYKLDQKADSVLQDQLTVAELSQNKNLILATLFSQSVNNIGTWTKTETFDRTLRFIEKGLDYAKEMDQTEYVALAYIRKAALLRKRGEYDAALQQAALAFSAIGSEKMDSVKAVLSIELGAIYQAKSDALAAYKNFNNAFDIAYKIQSPGLQSEIYHQFAWLYQSLGDTVLAKTNLLKSLALSTAANNQSKILSDYIDLARITNKKEFILKAIKLATDLQLDRELLFAKRLMVAYHMVVEKNSAAALSYFKNNNDLTEYYLNQGSANYNWNIGNIYKYSGKPDSALHYYHLAAPEMQKSFANGTRRFLFRDIADCYALLGNSSKAIELYEQSLALGSAMKDFAFVSPITQKLSELYAATGNYKRAFDYNVQFANYKDTLQVLSAKREVALLGVDREAKKIEKDLEDKAKAMYRLKTLQYWAIGAAIAIIFAFVLFLGMFTISKFVINLISFFAFVCLFEFIILLIDAEYLHHITHGEPFKLWLIKIFLIALLVPCQHFLEHALTKFVGSRRLLKLRKNISLHKWWAQIKKPVAHNKPEFEDNTAVL
ncbi:MAG TPA: tetratricopeptide repeat protein [Flavisolibacter sp.]